MYRFPFDNQRCDLHFGTPELKASELLFRTFNGSELNKDIDDNAWEISHPTENVANKNQSIVINGIIEDSEKSVYIISFKCARRPFTIIINLIVPTLLISVCLNYC